MKSEQKKDLWKYEADCFAKGVHWICGADEAGAGPLAGPVYAAAVILPPYAEIPGLDDSKKLSEKKREQLYDLICQTAVAWAVARAEVEEIESINILNARMLAMHRAIENLSVLPEFALIDGNRSTGIACPNRTIIKGDGESASIAAASVLAKVSRDRYMIEMDAVYPGYLFAKHKGYPTKAHYERLRQLGPCPIHRRSFLRNL
ncbi:MAG: ribonuclease HII [Oscillospiraceae bacterium]|nr:ribonuclease HII [Oscillospiraceae bacterium]